MSGAEPDSLPLTSAVSRTRARILAAAVRLLAQNPRSTLGDIANAAGVSRSTLHRHFEGRSALVDEASRLDDETGAASEEPGSPAAEAAFPPGRLGRERPVSLEAIHVFDVVAPSLLPEQLVAEAQRIAEVPLGLYVVDIDGSHLTRVAGPERLPGSLNAPLAIGPELDADGLAELRAGLADRPGIEVVPLWLRGRAVGVFLTLGKPRRPLTEMARQAAAAVALAGGYSDTFARGQRRKQPKAAAEIQQSLLPARISRVTGGEVAGNVLPCYEVAGDWFDVVENLDGTWITLADGLGASTPAAASSAVALGALRASRRSGGGLRDALLLMHATLKEMPGPRAEMTAVVIHWDPASYVLQVASAGHTRPLVVEAAGDFRELGDRPSRGLGGRSSPRPEVLAARLEPGERMIAVSDGVVGEAAGQAGLAAEEIVEAAAGSEGGGAADTVRRIHRAVLEKSGGDLSDDATVVCLAAV